MQIKIFTIPIMGGGKLLEEMNVFLRFPADVTWMGCSLPAPAGMRSKVASSSSLSSVRRAGARHQDRHTSMSL